MQKSLGKGEGSVNILAWPGYAEDGSNDPKVDWVTPFENQTGCKAKVKYFGTSDEAVSLMKSGDYDVVSASGDASLRLIAGGNVAPFNTDLATNYEDVAPFLKDRAWNSVDGQMYGMPHGWGANLLMYRTDKVKPAPDVLVGGLRRRARSTRARSRRTTPRSTSPTRRCTSCRPTGPAASRTPTRSTRTSSTRLSTCSRSSG